MTSQSEQQPSAAVPDTARNYVGGWIDANGDTHDIINPATGEAFADITYSTEVDVDEAVDVAHDAFQEWRETPPI